MKEKSDPLKIIKNWRNVSPLFGLTEDGERNPISKVSESKYHHGGTWNINPTREQRHRRQIEKNQASESEEARKHRDEQMNELNSLS
jgi:hypothetical protein